LEKKERLDQLDYKILKILMSDSRTSFSKIARKSKTSVSTIRNRFNQLKDKGIITGEIMDIDPTVLGYKSSAIIMIKTISSATSNILAQLKDLPGFLSVAKGFGRKNVICFVATRDTDELNNLVEIIRNISGVLDVKTNLIIRSTRLSYPENIQFVE
jgi:DNA-binding Lrp family transcriptional regulator